jgi:acetyl-CoA acetyltransferase
VKGEFEMRAFIPYGGYWTSPFAKWQQDLSHLHSVTFAAHVAKAELAARDIDPGVFDFTAFGMTGPQKKSFYAPAWAASLYGADRLVGPIISQACATGTRLLATAAGEIAANGATAALLLAAERLSNSPHLYYPNPRGPGGNGESENWVLDNFAQDPWAHVEMIETAENVARKLGIDTGEQHELVLHRYEQYQAALVDDHAFQKRYMTLPFQVPDERYRGTRGVMTGDVGVHPTTREGLARLRPVREGGTVTYGAQTFPADGTAAAIVVDQPDRAARLSRNRKIGIELVAFGMARTDKAYMPLAPIDAAKKALTGANLAVSDIDVFKSHNPFAVNDIAFARAYGLDWHKMNNYGCSLIWGHPNAATALRSVIELIEELVIRGGGYGLFQGCSAGDSAMATIVKVYDAN